MFPGRWKGWIILEIGKEQEKEPQSKQKGKDGISHPVSGTGVQPNIKSAFQRKGKILHHLYHTAGFRQLSTGCALEDLNPRPTSQSCGLVTKGSWRWGGSDRGGGWTLVPPQTLSLSALFICLLWAFPSYLLILLGRDFSWVSVHPIWNSDRVLRYFYSQDALVCNSKFSTW